MIKSLIAASVLCLGLAAPALAGSGGCDDDEAWSKLEADVGAMPAGADKDAAMAEWKMAGEARTAKNMNECDNHMTETRNKSGKKG